MRQRAVVQAIGRLVQVAVVALFLLHVVDHAVATAGRGGAAQRQCGLVIAAEAGLADSARGPEVAVGIAVVPGRVVTGAGPQRIVTASKDAAAALAERGGAFVSGNVQPSLRLTCCNHDHRLQSAGQTVPQSSSQTCSSIRSQINMLLLMHLQSLPLRHEERVAAGVREGGRLSRQPRTLKGTGGVGAWRLLRRPSLHVDLVHNLLLRGVLLLHGPEDGPTFTATATYADALWDDFPKH